MYSALLSGHLATSRVYPNNLFWNKPQTIRYAPFPWWLEAVDTGSSPLTNIRFTVALNHRHGSKRKNDYTKISLETPKVSQQTRSKKTGLQLFNMLSTAHVACRCLFGARTCFLGRSNVVRYFTSCLFCLFVFSAGNVTGDICCCHRAWIEQYSSKIFHLTTLEAGRLSCLLFDAV